jgi:undecaprenyl-diphosphatase
MIRRIIIAVSIGLLIAVGLGYLGIKARWRRAPYPSASKAIAWAVGCSEEAYNFEVVVPGRIYRSARPDERWYRYVHDKYGVRHIVRLNGPNDPVPPPPRDLDMIVTMLNWRTGDRPPREELDKVLGILDGPEPVLVHCWAGADRTGYAIAAYRIVRQGWPAEKAFAEMNRFWHFPDKLPRLQEDLRKLKSTVRQAGQVNANE